MDKKKYGADDASTHKYSIGDWLYFKMVDSNLIVEQVHEYENLVAKLMSEGMSFEVQQANALIEKLLFDSWLKFCNKIKQNKQDLKMFKHVVVLIM